MSAQATAAVLKHSESKLGARCVMIAIADHAHPDGTGADPGIERIARMARLSERQAQRAIRVLEELGELHVGRGQGRNGTHAYTIVLPGLGNKRGDNLSSRELLTDGTQAVGDVVDAGTMSLSEGGDNMSPPAHSSTGNVTPDKLSPRQIDGASNQVERGDISRRDLSPEPKATQEPKPRMAPPSSPRSSTPRKPDPIWDALIAAGYPQPQTRNERSRWNVAAKQLREIDATPEDIIRRAREYRRQMPGAQFTPLGLVSNWSSLKPGSPPPSVTDRGPCPNPRCDSGFVFAGDEIEGKCTICEGAGTVPLERAS